MCVYGELECVQVTPSHGEGRRYRNTTDNDLQYWGLDYPPLTAYASWVIGKMAKVVEPGLVELHASRGYETETSKVPVCAVVPAVTPRAAGTCRFSCGSR